MSDQTLAELIALAAIAAILILLVLIKRKFWVTKEAVEYTDGGGVSRKLAQGARIPDGHRDFVDAAKREQVRWSALSGIVIGKDHRTSTSKTVAFTWTLAIAYGLLALLIAKWLGDPTGWKKQVGLENLQEEYLIFLGGPYAAAVFAKYRATSASGAGTASSAGQVGTATPTQLISDDEGDTDLGDFQYVLFNAIALVCFAGDFVGDLDSGFPDLPELLAGLALTSVAGYAAKKFVSDSPPTLSSVVPSSAAKGGSVAVYGQHLIVPAELTSAGAAAAVPTVIIGGQKADVTAHEQILGADHLTVTVPTGATAGAGTLSAVRADGAPATGSAGSDGIPFTVTG